MADVTPERSGAGGRDRAQLFVVAAFGLAVTLVALALLLNAAIYTENLATRDASAGGDAALEFRATTAAGVGGLVDRENARGYGSQTAVCGAVRGGVEEFDDLVSARHSQRGTLASVAATGSDGCDGMTNGTYVARNGSGTFTANGNNSWTVATEVDRARGFRVRVDDVESLSNESADALNITFTNASGENHSVLLVRNGSAVDAEVVGGTVCTVNASGGTTLDLTAETLGGEPCEGIWPEEYESYDVRIRNGDAVAGSFAVTFGPNASPTAAAEDEATVDVSPAVYDVALRARYRTSELAFETTVRVAPGEFDG